MYALKRLFGVAPLLFVSACATGGPSSYSTATAPDLAPERVGYAAIRTDDDLYRIGAGDELALHFLVNPDLNAAVIVGTDGRGVFPLVGGVKVIGMTLDEANSALTNAYAAVLRNPKVEALVTAYGSSQIYVGGEVREPGVKAIKGRISVTQAIMAAGGFQDTARTGQVAVLRPVPGRAAPSVRMVNVGKVLHGDGDGGDMLLLPGDVVFAPRSTIADVDLFVKQYVSGLIPFNFSYGISANGHF